ncbi:MULTISPECIES: hypothetical protein [Salipiger]|jgi:hypothetical protein|uniref:Uncharacterized protein n=1 Tax=Salipiger profundus TaxID=1229727 RepID=A0A1U7D561_9RHOB|nr:MULTISPECIES: hypothetical protein [Salipiger]APX23205.1 hypothetical protein Ga0080559_TMP2409 [Salipiger profundus]GGA14034.1 hypothetical protein GCM10011326_27720 [Salipiger profundus]
MTRPDVSNRTLGVMLIVSWLALLLFQPLTEAWDDRPSQRPWIDVSLQLDGDHVLYTRMIKRVLRGDWTARVQISTGEGWRTVCDDSGAWTYRPETSGTLSMTFDRFTGGCPQPSGAHRVCVDYVMEDLRGRRRIFGPFCSEGTGGS